MMASDSKTKLITDPERDGGIRDAAFETLRQLLDKKSRGDRITAAEIRDALGFDQWDWCRSKVRRYLRSKQMYVESVRNDGYRILTATEHADHAERKRRTALRAEVGGLGALEDAPTADLDEKGLRRVQFLRVRAESRVRTGITHEQETRRELGTATRGDRIPLLRDSAK
jgi:hypothetical protein